MPQIYLPRQFVGVRIGVRTLQRIDELAKRDGITRSKMIRAMIDHYLEKTP